MCGFSGQIVAQAHAMNRVSQGYFEHCAARLVHRGDTETKRLLGPQEPVNGARYRMVHHRLAFQDLALGSQPMKDSSGKWIIVFNGEIYNHLALRKTLPELQNLIWQTQSDTETLVEGFAAMGANFFSHLDGEYAFVIIREDGTEFWAHRDPSGVKPLYFHLEGLDTNIFACHRKFYQFSAAFVSFASEIKGLAQSKHFDREGLLRQFTGLYEPLRTPFRHIIALCGGGVLHATHHNDTFQVQLYTNAKPIRNRPRVDGNVEAWIDQFSDAFSQSVSERLLSDVELGVYLSGGVDSRAVASQLSMSANPRFGRHAFTVGFKAEGYDESLEARTFAHECGFTSHLLMLDQSALSYSYPLAVEASENIQPYTNGAAKWWLSRVTRQHVKGVLTGDGADELLCGYPSFRYAKWWMHAMRARDGKIDGLLSNPLGTLPRDGLYMKTFLNQTKDPWLSGSSAAGSGLDFVESLATWGVPHPLYGQISSIANCLLGADAGSWLESQGQSIRSWFQAGFSETANLRDPSFTLILWQNYFFRTHLPVQVLNWVGDRMEMANVLEGRTPFLSKRMRDLVQTLPDKAMVHGFEDKFILRRALSRWVRQDFAKAPKKQFGAPFISLPKDFDECSVAQALEEAGLDATKILRRIEEKSARIDAMLDKSAFGQDTGSDFLLQADAQYEKSHLAQVKQTLVCLAIVKHTLVDEKTLSRNDSLESQILSDEQISTPASAN